MNRRSQIMHEPGQGQLGGTRGASGDGGSLPYLNRAACFGKDNGSG
jgi:hypothetical protein